jgi:sortase (surface protein transpeptidase)
MSARVRRSRFWAAAGTVLVVTAAVVLVVALRAQKHAPRPPASAATPVSVIPSVTPSSRVRTKADKPQPTTRGPILAASDPVRLTIPAIDVNSVITQLGLNPDHTVQVPPLGEDSYAGWYKYSPTPGQLGPSIILGHVDSAQYGPGVFFRLGALRQRDRIEVARADHSIATFEVERVVEYSKNHFPTLEVYGNTDHAALRLITCGGRFNLSAHSYDDNIVAYASLVSVRKA